MSVPKADYSAIASGYDEGRLLPGDTMRHWVGLIRDRGRLTSDSLCLDLGCGTGRFTIPIVQMTGAKAVGADLSGEMLAQASSKPGADEIFWVQCNAERLAFRRGTFDCIFMSLLLHHVDSIDVALRECFNALRPGGVCLVRTSAHEDMITMPVYRFFPRAWEIDRNRLPEISVIEDSMRLAGLRQAGHEKITQTLVTSADAYMDKMRRRNISALTFLTDKEMEDGLRRMEEHFRSIGDQAALEEVATEQLTLVVGEK